MMDSGGFGGGEQGEEKGLEAGLFVLYIFVRIVFKERGTNHEEDDNETLCGANGKERKGRVYRPYRRHCCNIGVVNSVGSNDI